ncbi:MAG: hypothetical protein PHF97_06810 [Bacteroidales bacterium]|nr:hypothetical protein [Bacteroidales bacterium]MDD4603500.1 hypothetical protein [Bacteroidales bacterium]
MRTFKKIILLFILGALIVSSLQFRLKPIHETPLKGYYRLGEAPSLKLFTWKRWFSGFFQEEYSTRLNDYVGFRKTLIRISNQYDYSFYGIIHANGFVQGRNRYLFEEDYIHEYTGDYFIGKAAIDRKMFRLKNVQDSLEAHHIPLLVVFEPGKASFYPEYIPSRFHPERKTLSNYEYCLQLSQQLGLSVIDMNRYFLKLKDTSRYPLFPRYGMHWSLYGVPFAVDTLVKSIKKAKGTGIPEFRIQQLTPSQTPLGTDNDIGELLNLACPLKSALGVYPKMKTVHPESKKFSVLVIADSYYLNIVEDYGKKMFVKQDYWYYNNKLYPYQNNSPPTYVDKSGLFEKLKNYDLILLMVSEINLHCGFWNFADEAYHAFHPGAKDLLLYDIENQIRNDREWFRSTVNKARLQQKPLEQIIRSDAEYTFYNNYSNLQGKTYWDTIEYITLNIKNNADWLASVIKKAEDRNVTVDSMLIIDAVYSYKQSKKKP